jgi:diguanylate cyclase (GGDEF)-like protein
MAVGNPHWLRGNLGRHQRRLEAQVLLLQSAIAGFFVAGVLFGWLGSRSTATNLGAAWIGAYHVVHAGYVLRYRIRGTPLATIEAITPLLDISCITTAWVVMGDPQSPFWAVYLYALVGYARRYYGMAYLALSGFIVVNVIFGRLAISIGEGGGAAVDSELLTMVMLTGAMASLAYAIGAAWRRAERQARLLAETDPLTGIANRRVFLERLESLTADREARFALLMLDLDDFKRLNDEHGHLHGDDVLANVAGVLTDSVREGDLVARYGGEEFVVAMPGTELSAAVDTAERLRLAIFDATPTSVSIGCAVREPGESAQAVLKRADDLLLSAKRTGKNAVRSGAALKLSA